jgi:hypothetical protein
MRPPARARAKERGKRQVEALRQGQHRDVRRVDQLAAPLRDLVAERARAIGMDAPAGAAGLKDLRRKPRFVQGERRGQPLMPAPTMAIRGRPAPGTAACTKPEGASAIGSEAAIVQIRFTILVGPRARCHV